jgi:hypothetical protein
VHLLSIQKIKIKHKINIHKNNFFVLFSIFFPSKEITVLPSFINWKFIETIKNRNRRNELVVVELQPNHKLLAESRDYKKKKD